MLLGSNFHTFPVISSSMNSGIPVGMVELASGNDIPSPLGFTLAPG
jgi:hypothetical protein